MDQERVKALEERIDYDAKHKREQRLKEEKELHDAIMEAIQQKRPTVNEALEALKSVKQSILSKTRVVTSANEQ